jgi:hypothetical protein
MSSEGAGEHLRGDAWGIHQQQRDGRRDARRRLRDGVRGGTRVMATVVGHDRVDEHVVEPGEWRGGLTRGQN